MEWTPLTDSAQLEEIDRLSADGPVLIFKHSTQCPVSAAALSRMNDGQGPFGHPAFYLDLLAHRPVSNAVEARYSVQHESPQALVIRKGRCVHHASHRAITYGGTVEAMQGA